MTDPLDRLRKLLPEGALEHVSEYREHRELAGCETERGLRILVRKADAAIAELLAAIERQAIIIAALDRSELRIASAGGSWTLKEFMQQIDLARRTEGGRMS
jgi:hypothetical protein